MLILHPILKFVNANVRPCDLVFKKGHGSHAVDQIMHQILPSEKPHFYHIDSENINFILKIANFKDSKEIKLSKERDRRKRIEIKLTHSNNKFVLYLYLDMVRRSQVYREITLYCPYVISNQADLLEFQYRESGLTSNIYR